MSDVTINYKGQTIATLDTAGGKTLLTAGKYCEDDINIRYQKSNGIWGLIATIEVPRVNSFYTPLPRSAIDGGIVWEVMHDVTLSSADYYYGAVVSDDGTPGDNSGYSSRLSTLNGTFVYCFHEPVTIDGIDFPGASGSSCLTPNFTRLRRTDVMPFTRLGRKLYNSNTVFTGGTIEIYGRIS